MEASKGSSPYMICTPELGNSANGRYFVKFGDSATDAARLKTYDTYQPPGNRVTSQLPKSTEYQIDGKMMELQIFQASNKAFWGRKQWTRAAGQTKTEWYEVWPKNTIGQLDAGALADVMTDNERQADAKVPFNKYGEQPFLMWLHNAFQDSWRVQQHV
ncbi:hypothetical protein MD484_g6531, partial [Candolleomyces efflorescens]